MAETLFEQSGLTGPFERSRFATESLTYEALVDNSRFAFLLALAIDLMFFGGLIGAYFVLRGSSPFWLPPEVPLPHFYLAIASAVLLCVSSMLFAITIRAQRENKLHLMRSAFLSALVLVGTFLALNSFEWSHLLSSPATIHSIFGGLYLIITGAFHLHVVAGGAYSSMKLKQMLHWRKYTRSSTSIAHLAYYFLALSVVWVAILGVIYIF